MVRRKTVSGFKDNIAFDLNALEMMDSGLAAASEALRPKHRDMNVDENEVDAVFSVQLVAAPFNVMSKTLVSPSRIVELTLNATDFTITLKKTQILQLNYMQISKWMINKEVRPDIDMSLALAVISHDIIVICSHSCIHHTPPLV